MRKIWKPVSDKKFNQICYEPDINNMKNMMKEIVYKFVHKNKQRRFLYDIDKPSYDKRKDLLLMITNLKLIVEGLRVK